MLSLALLLPTSVLAAVFAGTRNVITTSADRAHDACIADFNGDGHNDVAGVAYFDNAVMWFENTNGLGSFGPKNTISTSHSNVWAIHCYDVDGDGDVDIVVGVHGGATLEWHENLNGLGSFGSAQLIASHNSPRAMASGDIRGDGSSCIIATAHFATYLRYYCYPALVAVDVDHTFPAPAYKDVDLGDVDNDGKLDVLHSTDTDDRVMWFRNNGTGGFSQRLTITDTLTDVRSSRFADFNGDGHLDVVAVGYGGVVRVFLNDGFGLDYPFVGSNSLSTTMSGAMWVLTHDFDRDGDEDVMAVSYTSGDLILFLNANGLGTSWTIETIFSNLAQGRRISIGDLDGDGDYDVVVTEAASDRFAWFENLTPPPPPTLAPTTSPTPNPTQSPTPHPTLTPTVSPTPRPTMAPTSSPTLSPTVAPTVSPTAAPTLFPTTAPTTSPTTVPTVSPTVAPTVSPTAAPTVSPTAAPTVSPSAAPTVSPSAAPTVSPSAAPTVSPTSAPTSNPTSAPTAGPTVAPSPYPTAPPVTVPTPRPTSEPTSAPTSMPTKAPSVAPTPLPTAAPSPFPTKAPSVAPTAAPSPSPTEAPSVAPTASPTIAPSPSPTEAPSLMPTTSPTMSGAAPFTTYSTIATSVDYVSGLCAGDFDGDGRVDILATTCTDGEVLFFPRSGVGTYPSRSIVATITNIKAVACGDVDGDGDEDLVVASHNPSAIWYLENVGGSQPWTSPVQIGDSHLAYDVAIADIDNDGTTEVVTARYALGAAQVYRYSENSFTGPSTPIEFGADCEGAVSIAIGDFVGDSEPDVVLACQGSDELQMFERPLTMASLTVIGNETNLQRVMKVDMNGTTDVVSVSDVPGSLRMVSTTGEEGEEIFSAPHVAWVVGGDFDNDGVNDFVTSQFTSDALTLHRRDGPSAAWEHYSFAVGEFSDSYRACAADVDGDGGLDLITASRLDGTLSIFLNQITTVAPSPSPTPAPTSVLPFAQYTIVIALRDG